MTGRDLRTLREACGVTREELARAMGWSVLCFDALEFGNVHFTPDDVARCVCTLARIVRARTPVAVIDAAT